MYRSLENNLVPGFHYYDYYESVYLSCLVLPESFGGLFAIFHFQTGSVLLATHQPFPTKINIQEKKKQKNQCCLSDRKHSIMDLVCSVLVPGLGQLIPHQQKLPQA